MKKDKNKKVKKLELEILELEARMAPTMACPPGTHIEYTEGRSGSIASCVPDTEVELDGNEKGAEC